MTVVNVWRTSLILAGALASACGAASGVEQEPQGLITAQQALACSASDTTPPVLTLNGPDYMRTECYTPTHDPSKPGGDLEVDPDPYIEQGAQAMDQCDGDLTSHVQAFGELNKQMPGVYMLEYDVSDNASNWADPIIRSVEVADTLPPKVVATHAIKVWPADGGMHTVQLSECAMLWDLCEGYMDIVSWAYDVQFTCNNRLCHSSDIALIDRNGFAVRASTNADGSTRVYTVRFKVDDASGNTGTGTCKVYVPHDPTEPPPALE